MQALFALCFAGVALVLEVSTFSRLHLAEAAVASDPDAQYRTCVSHATDSQVRALYQSGVSKCTNRQPRSEALLLAHVHTLHWLWHTKGDTLKGATAHAVNASQSAARNALRGVDSTLNESDVETALFALASQGDKPRTCADIYESNHSLAPFQTPPAKTGHPVVTIRCLDTQSATASAHTDAHVTTATQEADYDGYHDHCVLQFAQGASGLGDAFDVPVVGTPLYPGFRPLEELLPPRFANASAMERSRVLAGARLGWSAVAAVPATMLASFLAVDAVVCLASALTRPMRVDAAQGTSDGRLQAAASIDATFEEVRSFRNVLCSGAWVVLIPLRVGLGWAPWWDHAHTRPSSTCRASDAGGGWEPSTAFVYEGVALGCLLVATLAQCTCFMCTSGRGVNVDGEVEKGVRYAKTFALTIGVGLAVYVPVEASSAFVVGQTWAMHAVGAPRDVEAGTSLGDLLDVIANQLLDAVTLAIVGAALMAIFLGRYAMVSSVTTTSFVVYQVWIVGAALVTLPLVLLFAMRNLAALADVASADHCATFNARTAPYILCVVHYIAVSVAIISFIALLASFAIPDCCRQWWKTVCTCAVTKTRVVRLQTSTGQPPDVYTAVGGKSVAGTALPGVFITPKTSN